MKASPDSTLLLISTLYLSFHQWQNLMEHVTVPDSPFHSLFTQSILVTLGHCSEQSHVARSHGHLSATFDAISQHHWAVTCFLEPLPSLGFGDMHFLGFLLSQGPLLSWLLFSHFKT